GLSQPARKSAAVPPEACPRPLPAGRTPSADAETGHVDRIAARAAPADCRVADLHDVDQPPLSAWNRTIQTSAEIGSGTLGDDSQLGIGCDQLFLFKESIDDFIDRAIAADSHDRARSSSDGVAG